MSEELEVWKPREFHGSDLLPIHVKPIDAPDDIPIMVEDDVGDSDDLILPSLQLLQGQSQAVLDNEEGAQPGKFYHTGTREVFTPPVRLIVFYHYKNNVFFPRSDDKDHEGLEFCLSVDGVTGTRYGACEECRKCLDWREGPGGENLKPLGAVNHNFAAMTDRGIVVLRFGRTSFKAGKRFYSAWKLATPRRNWFHHPAVLTVERETNADGKPFFKMDIAWEVRETVPPAIQRSGHELYQQIHSAFELGKFSTHEDTEEAARASHDGGAM